MKTIKWTFQSQHGCCDEEGKVEVQDNATENEIEVAIREDVWRTLSTSLSWEAAS